MKIVQAHFTFKKTSTFCLRLQVERGIFFFQLKRKRAILWTEKMGCLKLTYHPEPTLFLEEQGERTVPLKWQVWTKETGVFWKVGEVVQTQGGPTEITAQMINDIIAGLPKDGTSSQFLGIAVDLLKKYDNAFVKGSTINGLIKSPSDEIANILSQINSINKKGSNVTLSITNAIKYDLPLGKLTINTSNKFAIDKLTSSLIGINVTGVQTVLGPLNRVEITGEAVQVRIKIGFVNAWKTVAEFK